MALNRTPENCVTFARVREVLDYDPLTGVFKWKVRLSPRGLIGSVAGGPTPKGYVRITIDGLPYLAQRLAWFYEHGVWPPETADHKDGEKANNRIANLRPASSLVNLQNLQRARSNSTTGFLGVQKKVWRDGTVVYEARISHPGKHRQYLGRRATPEEAHALYVEAKRKYHVGNTL